VSHPISRNVWGFPEPDFPISEEPVSSALEKLVQTGSNWFLWLRLFSKKETFMFSLEAWKGGGIKKRKGRLGGEG
jgi:hypothetical protein